MWIEHFVTVIALALAFLAARHADLLDRWILQFWARLKTCLYEVPAEEQALAGETRAIQAILAQLRTGRAPAEPPQRSSTQALKLILELGKEQGVPISGSLKLLLQLQQRRLRALRRGRSRSAQARAQALVAGLLPLMLFLAVCLIAPELINAAIRNTQARVLLVASCALTALGLIWIRRRVETVLLNPMALERDLEAWFPRLLLEAIGLTAAGVAPATVFENFLQKIPAQSPVKTLLLAPQGERAAIPELLNEFLELRERAITQGAPLRQSLLEIAEEFEQRLELRWETATELLPLRLLLPLFTCILPANLAALLAPLIPILGEMI